MAFPIPIVIYADNEGHTTTIKAKAITRGPLALHRSNSQPGSYKEKYGPKWTITHIPSGYALFTSSNNCAMRKALRELAKLQGWEKIGPDTVKTPRHKRLRDKAFAIAKRVGLLEG